MQQFYLIPTVKITVFPLECFVIYSTVRLQASLVYCTGRAGDWLLN